MFLSSLKRGVKSFSSIGRFIFRRICGDKRMKSKEICSLTTYGTPFTFGKCL